MTNAQIIFNNSLTLMENGILSGSGTFATMECVKADGTKEIKTVELPEQIHTFAAWKASGYIVKKGEKAIASFSIWKYKAHKHADDESDEQKAIETGDMFLTKAFFFKASQVEKLA